VNHALPVGLLLLAACGGSPDDATSPRVDLDPITREAVLMGTRARLVAFANVRSDSLATLDLALSVIEATDRELSTWRDDSDVSVLNRWTIGDPWLATGRWCSLLSDLYALHALTGGAFDPGVGQLIDAWDIHGAGRVPLEAELARARALTGLSKFRFVADACTLTRQVDVTLDTGGFGKGEALDRVVAKGVEGPWLIDLGGQLAVAGTPPGGGRWSVALAHPLARDIEALALEIPPGSLATSAGSERDLDVAGERVGHILDPRTGQPAAFTGSVSVWHVSALQAEALSTALYVMGPDEGLPWANALGLAAVYLIPDGDAARAVPTTAFEPLIVAR